MLCSLTDGEKLDGKGMPNLDVKYLRGERDFKTLTNGRYVAANSLLILVDGENSGEVFRTPIEGYQGSTFKQLHINENMLAEYILHVINLHRRGYYGVKQSRNKSKKIHVITLIHRHFFDLISFISLTVKNLFLVHFCCTFVTRNKMIFITLTSEKPEWGHKIETNKSI